MLKNLMIGAAFIAMAAGPAGAQHLEATLQKVEVPASSFDIVLAMAKPGGWTFDPAHPARRLSRGYRSHWR